MTIITKGMGAVLKGALRSLKKSKTFPGSKAHGQLINEKLNPEKLPEDRAFDVHARTWSEPNAKRDVLTATNR